MSEVQTWGISILILTVQNVITQRKDYTALLHPTQVPHGLFQDQTRKSAEVGHQSPKSWHGT
jgi:hypothetical protein